MARIAGVNIPDNKRVQISLRYIYGIGPKNAAEICEKLGIPEERRHHLAGINDFDQTGSCFVSHDKRDLGNARLDALKAMGVPILCWTIRSTEEEAVARRVADNITFEGYRATV